MTLIIRRDEIKRLHLGVAARAVVKSVYEELCLIENDLLVRINKALEKIDAKPLEKIMLTLRNGCECKDDRCQPRDDKDAIFCPRGSYNPGLSSIVLYCGAKIWDLSHLIVHHLQNTDHKGVVIGPELTQALGERMPHRLNPSEIEAFAKAEEIAKLLREEGIEQQLNNYQALCELLRYKPVFVVAIAVDDHSYLANCYITALRLYDVEKGYLSGEVLVKLENACDTHDVYLYSKFKLATEDPRIKLLARAVRQVGSLVYYFNTRCWDSVYIPVEYDYYNPALISLLDVMNSDSSLLTLMKHHIDESLSILQKRIELVTYELNKYVQRRRASTRFSSHFDSREYYKEILYEEYHEYKEYYKLVESCAEIINIFGDNAEEAKDKEYLLLPTRFVMRAWLLDIPIKAKTYVVANRRVVSSLKKLQEAGGRRNLR